MDSKIMGLDDLFHFQISYRIPQFQRPYAWGMDQWESLWDDVRKFANRILDADEDEELVSHFMGAIVVQARNEDAKFDEVRQVLVVDGQQRLTTLQLMIKAIEVEYTSSLASTEEFDSLGKYLFNEENRTGGDYLNQTKVRQSNGLDQADFQDIVRGRLESTRPSRPIVDAYRNFRNWVSSWLNEEPDKVETRCRALYKVLTEYLKFATIDLDHGEKPHFVFEILNSRGERLEQADYIKNTVMYEADVVDDGQKANTLWGMFEDDWWRNKESRGRELQMQLDRFLNYWCSMRMGDNIPMRKTATEFRKYVESEKSRKKSSIDSMAEDIRKAGIIYKNIEENRLAGIETFLKRVKTLEISVIMPPLLWLYTQDIPDEQRRRAVQALESFLVRRLLCNLGSQGLNALFIELVKHLEDNKEASPDQVLIDYLKPPKPENRLWPDDRKVIDYLLMNPMPGNAARRKMILEAIEVAMRPAMAEDVGDTSKLTVEHLLPQGWGEDGWPLSVGDVDKSEATAIRTAHIPMIGNLTLATKELNSSRSNRSWQNKRNVLGKYS